MEHLRKQRLGKLLMEGLWWLITLIVVWMITQPLWAGFVKYDFIYEVILFIVLFITYTRYLFGLKYTFLAHFQALKFILIFVSVPLAFYLIQVFFGYQDFLEKQNEGMIEFQEYFKEGLTFNEHNDLLAYLTQVYSFFGIGAILAVALSPFRLLVSFWRVYNKTGTV